MQCWSMTLYLPSPSFLKNHYINSYVVPKSGIRGMYHHAQPTFNLLEFFFIWVKGSPPVRGNAVFFV